MKQESLTYYDGDSPLIGQLLFDDQQIGKRPGVILFPAFEGCGAFVIEYAKKFVAQGYIALAADMYGEGKTADTIEGCYALIEPFLADRSLVRRRARLAFDAFAQQVQVDVQNIGAMGFCFGGMCVLEIARSGANLKAAVSAHGILAKSDLSTETIQSSILLSHGYQDKQVPMSQLDGFAKEMENAGVEDWSAVCFGKAKHSFTDPKTGTFDPEKEAEMGREYHQIAAERTYRYALDFFAEKLLNTHT